LYVPKGWKKGAHLPLVVVTHGAAQPATAPFARPMDAPSLAATAERHGYIVSAVTGYHANATAVGGWNVPYKMITLPRPPRPAAAGNAAPRVQPPPATAENFARAEEDVLYVADLVAREYDVDPNRVYLMGNSSGGSAVWTYGARYPERWAAISPSAAPLADADFPYERLARVPVLLVQGDADTVMSFDAAQTMADHAKAKGVDITWLPVAGGTHVEAWAEPAVVERTFAFFDAHVRTAH
jgi:poly(3-hydroxybutyrate) depolymerase